MNTFFFKGYKERRDIKCVLGVVFFKFSFVLARVCVHVSAWVWKGTRKEEKRIIKRRKKDMCG